MIAEQAEIALKGDWREHVHQASPFVGDWEAFASCRCGWKTKVYRRYYSPILNFDELWEMSLMLARTAVIHNHQMNSGWMKFRRALSEAWQEVSEKWKLKL